MQAAIGATGALAVDLTAACSGVVGVVNGVHFIRGGEYKRPRRRADVLSRRRLARPRDVPLFGDGCGAMVLTSTPDPSDCCLLGFDMHSDGTGNHNLTAQILTKRGTDTDGKSKPTAEGGDAPSSRGAFCNIRMNGQEVFKFGSNCAGHGVEVVGEAGMTARTSTFGHAPGEQAHPATPPPSAGLGPERW